MAELGLARLSQERAERLGLALGDLVRRPLGIRVGVVVENLQRAFPDAPADWIRETTLAAYRHLGRESVAMLRLSTLDRAAIREIVEVPDETWTALEAVISAGRGAILATGHYGNWEMAAAAVSAHGFPIEAIVKRQSNPLVDHRIEAARQALGVGTISMGAAARRVPRALAASRMIGIVADQDAHGSGVWVPFFGVPASSHRGPALFALRTGAPIFAAVARRLPDGRYHMRGDRIDTERRGTFDEDVSRITAALALHLESEIRCDPSQYFWFHKRWKTRPIEEPPPREPGTNTRDGQGAPSAHGQ